MTIPAFREDGWLPEGHHPATWEEVAMAFGGEAGTRRRVLFERLINWRDELAAEGVSGRLLLNGSFASMKQVPGDIDGLFVISESTEHILTERPASTDLISHVQLKDRGVGDIFCFRESTVRDFPAMCRLDGFDLDKETGRPKGLVEVRI